MFKKLYYIRKSNKIMDGGVSRDVAFYNYLKKEKDLKVKFLENEGALKKIIQMFKEGFYLLTLKNKKIFLHQNSINILFPTKIFSNRYISKVIYKILSRVARFNVVYLEINDLIYEQSLDLELLNSHQREAALRVQKKIFDINNISYIFASEEMRKYTIKNYKIDEKKTYTCINGSIELKEKKEVEILKNEKKIKCIYAGTLNRGRQIEELINIFENKLDNFILVLIGINGEWILENKYRNTLYLGSYDEKEALNIVSNCDIGLVPYDSNRFYYNLCYPTKNSFYISAGIPLLITPLKESLNQLSKYDILFIETLDKWSELLKKISKSEIEEKKKKIEKIKNKFLWENLIKEVFKKIKETNYEKSI